MTASSRGAKALAVALAALLSASALGAQVPGPPFAPDPRALSLIDSQRSFLYDPRFMSAIVLFAILAASLALSAAVSTLLLRRRIAELDRELQARAAHLEALEARQLAVLRAMPDLFLIFDDNGCYVGYYESGGDGFAVNPDTSIGKTVFEIFGSAELEARLLAAIRAALMGRGPQVFEYTLEMAPEARFEARVVKLTKDTVLAICRNVTERHQVEQQRNSSLLEKEVLLKEIHHRVKNNMQIISSLISMQSARARDAYDKELFMDSQSRIRAMAAVHDQLYRSRDFTSIPAREYLLDLVSGLEAGWSRPDRWIRASVEADDTTLELDRAVPIGLIVNELVTNSFKYAFGPGSSGAVSVGVRGRPDGTVDITVSDDGTGFPSDFTGKTGDGTMGYTIINALVVQLRGTIEVAASERGGAEVRISAPPQKRHQP